MLVSALNDALMTVSRGDWLHFVLSRLRDRLGGRALDFLLEDPDASHLETDESAFLLTAVKPSEIPGAIAQTNDWCASMLARPEILAATCERSVEYVQEQLATADSTGVFQGVSDDGDEPAYLFEFLGALRKELSRAGESGETVIHARLGF